MSRLKKTANPAMKQELIQALTNFASATNKLMEVYEKGLEFNESYAAVLENALEQLKADGDLLPIEEWANEWTQKLQGLEDYEGA